MKRGAPLTPGTQLLVLRHVAELLGVRETRAQTITREPTFPPPRKLPGEYSGRKKWLRAEVEAWLRGLPEFGGER